MAMLVDLGVDQKQRETSIANRKARCLLVAHRDISWQRSNSGAFGAKRTFGEPR